MTDTTAASDRLCSVCGEPAQHFEATCQTCGGAVIMRRGDGDPNLGRSLGGKYTVLSRLGRGGFGSVYRARDERLDRLVAIKLLHVDTAAHPGVLRRFHAEARNTSRLAHPNNIKVFDFGDTDDGLVYIVMELLDGTPLSRARVPMKPTRALSILRQIARAVGEAHSIGLIHRDLKPDNVIVSEVDGADFVRVLDYGIAKLEDGTTGFTDNGVFVGTPSFTSPEQLIGDDVDRRCDIYTFGLVAYELLSGAPPFQADDPIGVAVKHLQEQPPPLEGRVPLSDELKDLVASCLAKQPDDRPASMEDVVLAIDMLPELRDARLAHVDGSPTGPEPSAPYDTVPHDDPASFDDTIGFSADFAVVPSEADNEPATPAAPAPSHAIEPTTPTQARSNTTVLTAIGVMVVVVSALAWFAFRSPAADDDPPQTALDPASLIPPPAIAALPPEDETEPVAEPVAEGTADAVEQVAAAPITPAMLTATRGLAALAGEHVADRSLTLATGAVQARADEQRRSAAERAAEARRQREPEPAPEPEPQPDPRDDLRDLLGAEPDDDDRPQDEIHDLLTD